jgi:YYY domain-containing protein
MTIEPEPTSPDLTISLPATRARSSNRTMWVLDLLLVVVLLAGAYLRTAGLYWGEYQYLHPDERFLVWVGTDISPTKIDNNGAEPKQSWLSVGEYFDTVNSSLNPNNRGHGFYVYGTLPMFITRFAVQWIFGHSGFDVMTQVGRALSALTDLLTVLMVYLIAGRLYDKRVGLLAAAFSAAAVLQIQQSHFYTMDTFANLFTYLAIYFAVRIMTDQRPWPGEQSEASTGGEQANPSQPPRPNLLRQFFGHPLFWLSIAFGLAYGAAMASKISIVPVALMLPAAVAIRISTMPRQEWGRRAWQAFVFLAIAGLTSLVVFRLAQPYAFSGPGLLGVKLNPAWLQQIREQRAQATPEVDYPPAMQWARRPIWFSGQNLIIWGLGLPLGLLAVASFLGAGWDMLKGNWRKHLLLWAWTGGFFIWQSMAINPTMRYQLPIYPALAIFAAWGVVHLWDIGKARRQALGKSRPGWLQIVAVVIGGSVLALTLAYAYGFSSIYTRPITRIEGSRWIYQNIPGPINLHIETADGVVNQPLPFPYNSIIMPQAPYTVSFVPQASGTLQEIYFPYIWDTKQLDQPSNLTVTLSTADGASISSAGLTIEPTNLAETGAPARKAYTAHFEPPVELNKGQGYTLTLEMAGEAPVAVLDNRASLRFITEFGDSIDLPAFPNVDNNWKRLRADTQFLAPNNGLLSEIFLPVNDASQITSQPLTMTVDARLEGSEPNPNPDQIAGTPTAPGDPRGMGYLFQLPLPTYLTAGQKVEIVFDMLENKSALTMSGAGIANEGEWDDGMPVRIDGYDGFGGIYPLDLNFNMYWDDNDTKLERFLRILDESDYIVITSNRQWGSLTRIPERFPLTTLYYRNLLGCPADQDIVWCYRVAEPGMFKGNLGFELVKIFQSDPQIGSLTVNDQFGEEAFTVYDHPKVFIFKKTDNYDSQKVQDLLSSVDFSKVIRLAPLKFKMHPADLLLPLQRWTQQQLGGTWSEIFNSQTLLNHRPWVGAVAWYLSLALLGLIVFPILRLALPGLPDRGYPLARTAGMLILSYVVWVAGSYQVPFTRNTISIVLLALVVVGIGLAIWQRRELGDEWRKNKSYYLMIEGLFLAFFLLDLLIRLGNPDLWHPYKGGEKPMDFAYFNAILKSTSFPPYDPWFAGGYLNYYYYGFVLVGTLVKWLGITPAVAYNLILPTMFALIAMGAFSIAWNLYVGAKRRIEPLNTEPARIVNDPIPTESEAQPDHRGSTTEQASQPSTESELKIPASQTPIPGNKSIAPFWVGLSGALGMALLGNLGTVKMIYQGFQRLAAPGGVIENSTVLMRLIWAVQGFAKNLAGAPLPYGIGDWYWNPSRAIPAPGEVEPITEFPFFTVLYADPHAHLYALSLALLAIGFALSVVLARGRWKGILSGLFGFLIGGLAIGALRPTNTWDFYTYLALGIVALAYAFWRYYQPIALPPDGSGPRSKVPRFFAALPAFAQRLIVTLGGVGLLIGLSVILFFPFLQWYGLGYSKIDFWQGLRTPLNAYFTHWGLFLFVIVSWLIWETRDWLANTPVSALRKLSPYRGLIIGAVAFLILTTIALAIKLPQTVKTPFGNGIGVAIVALPLAAWAGTLILRPDRPDAKRFTLFLIGTGLVLTLMVEIIVLIGDIGRMNTVFKFYLQVWTLFAVSAAAALGWLLASLFSWSPGWRNTWVVILAVLVAGAMLFPLTAGRAKILDRMTADAPHTLDGSKFMEYSTYDWQGPMDLSQDYRAIRWMQENILGSPVIVEANLRDLYRWGSRFSIYTGLPGVVGWEWHQQQQRALVPGSWVSDRISEVDNFYNTTDLQAVKEFLAKYNVRYIILGQLERNHYPGPGLDKFAAQTGILWNEIYRDGNTIIYEVIGSGG